MQKSATRCVGEFGFFVFLGKVKIVILANSFKILGGIWTHRRERRRAFCRINLVWLAASVTPSSPYQPRAWGECGVNFSFFCEVRWLTCKADKAVLDTACDWFVPVEISLAVKDVPCVFFFDTSQPLRFIDQ